MTEQNKKKRLTETVTDVKQASRRRDESLSCSRMHRYYWFWSAGASRRDGNRLPIQRTGSKK